MKSIDKIKLNPLAKVERRRSTMVGDLETRISVVIGSFPTRKEAAKVADVSVEQLARYEKGQNWPPFPVLARLAKSRGISLDWLAWGEGPMELGASHSVAPTGDSYPPAHLLPEGMVPVPMLDARAGFGAGQLVENLPRKPGFVAFSEDWIRRRLRVDPRDLLLVEGQGDSMVPTIVDGGVLLVWTALDRVKDGAIYAVVLEGELMVKRLQRLPGGRVKVKTDNPAYDDYELDADSAAALQVVGQVIWKGAPA